MKNAVPQFPILAYQWPPNLKDLLVRATVRLLENIVKGTAMLTPLLQTCEHLKTEAKFTSTVTGKTNYSTYNSYLQDHQCGLFTPVFKM